MKIPLIDLEPWFRGGDADRRVLADSVDRHLQDVGFLLVMGHGIDPVVFTEAREAARRFYALPTEVKQQYRGTGESYRGWVGTGEQSNAGAYGIDTPPDLKETYALGNPDVDDELRRAAPRWFGPTPYPDEVPEFGPALDAFMRASRALVDELLVLLAVALRVPEHTLLDACRNTIATGNANWYPPRTSLAAEPRPGQFRIGPHFDYGTVTVLDREPGMGGLEVRVGDEWVTAPWVDGALTINTGLLMGRWSNDRWSPNEHRVLPPPTGDPAEELISLVYFHDPDHDAVIAPLEGTWSHDNPRRYEPVLAGDHLASMLDALAVDG